jgi:sigma-B regulation protein RsbU (phosphoserine phosphatase)
MLVMYTDGLTDAQNAQKTCMGEDAAAALVRAGAGTGVREMVASITRAVDIYQNGTPQFDDITLLAVKVPTA